MSHSAGGEQTALPPDIDSGPADEIWATYFEQNRPTDVALRRLIFRLHERKEHEHVIHAIQAALLNGQTQPWMYEVLALSMEIAGRPKEDVQRVLLSLTDFGNANFESMMYSAAYLTRFERNETALRLYRQASRMAPERPEPYILGLKIAEEQSDREAILWAAAGILKHGWTKNYKELHLQAENAIAAVARDLKKQNDDQALAELKQKVTEARQRDLMVTLTWNGAADLDLIVEEPGGTVCSFDSPDSPGGGIHLNDGYGPNKDNCREVYVCPQGISGNYRLRIHRAWGDVVGKRAQLTITTHAGTPQEKTSKQVVVLDGDEAVVSITLEDGRRTKPRDVATSQLDPLSAVPTALPLHGPGNIRLTGHEQAGALQRFNDSRQNAIQQAGGSTTTGAVGFQSVISVVPDGSFLQVNPVISADRRYVRMAVNPVFTTLTDVFQFSFINGQ